MNGAPAHFEAYLSAGCGRCALAGTPSCKVLTWTAPLEAMRTVLLANGLDETIKWGVPTYTYRGKNAAILSALKDRCTLAFFQGAAIPHCAPTELQNPRRSLPLPEAHRCVHRRRKGLDRCATPQTASKPSDGIDSPSPFSALRSGCFTEIGVRCLDPRKAAQPLVAHRRSPTSGHPSPSRSGLCSGHSIRKGLERAVKSILYAPHTVAGRNARRSTVNAVIEDIQVPNVQAVRSGRSGGVEIGTDPVLDKTPCNARAKPRGKRSKSAGIRTIPARRIRGRCLHLSALTSAPPTVHG